MTRLEVSGGTLTAHSATTPSPLSPDAGTVIKIAGNDRGVWVVGDARTSAAGSFSARVQLFTKKTDITIAGACAYASSYPPVSNWLSDVKLGFTGTPMYEVTLTPSGGGADETVEAGSTFLLPCSYTVSSFTDKTGAPGIINCFAPTNLKFTPSAATICAGATVTLTASATDAVAYSLDGSSWQAEAVFEVSTESPKPYTLYAKTAEGCVASAANAAAVAVNPLPENLSLMSTLMAVCNGQPTTLTASASGGAQYSLNGTDWYVSPEFNVTPQPDVPYTLYVKTAAGCSATKTNAATVTVNPLPTGLTLTPASICAGESATLTASASDGVRYRIDNGAWTTATTFSVTPDATTNYPLYVQTAAGCSATKINAATVTVNPIPDVPEMDGAATQCNNPGTITAVAGANGDGIRWTDNSTTVTPRNINLTGTYYAVTTSAAGCESGTASISVTINPSLSINRTGGNASQTVVRSTPITNIVYYTTSASATISSSSSFPGGVYGNPSGSSFTIYGSPSSTGTFGYTVAVSRPGCVSASASGNIVVIDTPPNAASKGIWIIGSQIWSDEINISACSTNSLADNDDNNPGCHYGGYASSGYHCYYNWRYVDQNAGTLCPSPWRVPSRTDFNTVIYYHTAATLQAIWPYNGYANGNGYYNYNTFGYYWTSTGIDAQNAYQFSYSTSDGRIITASDGRKYGFAVRCVR
jgi:hypothetical protein